MKCLLTVCLVALLQVAHAQSDPSQPYAFKNDRLGMPLADFQRDHAPTKIRVNINRSGGTPVWGEKTDPGARCTTESSAVTTCGYASTIVDTPANVSDSFVNGKLVEIRISFGAYQGTLDTLEGALRQKMGGASEVRAMKSNASLGSAMVWSNATSIAQLQPTMCMAHMGVYDTDANHTALDLDELLAGEYCVNGQSLSSSYSLLIFADKELAKAYIQRLADAAKASSDKAKGDL